MQDIGDFLEKTRQECQLVAAEFKDHVREVRSKAKPLRYELVTTTDTDWMTAPAVQELTRFLCGVGFQAAGVVAAKSNPKTVIAGFAAPQHAVYASVPKVAAQVLVSFVSDFADGSLFECSNMPVPWEPPYPSWLTHVRQVGTPAPELWAYFLQERPSKTAVAVSPDSFANSSVEQMFRYRAWIAERGGWTREELGARYRAAGKLPPGPEGERLLEELRNNEAERTLCDWWRLQADAPYPLDQVMDSLVIIHDELLPLRLLAAYWGSTRDFRAREADFSGSSPRDCFARVVADRGAGLRRVLQKCTPLEADFYVPE